MKKLFTMNYLFVFVMLLSSLGVQAADEDLITEQVTIRLDWAGDLPNKIGWSKKYKITNLKIIGKIDASDLRLIREMAGCDSEGYSTDGKLQTLDLSEAKIVDGGYDYYLHQAGYYYYTKENVIGESAFADCRSLKNLMLPLDIIAIDDYAFWGCTGLVSLTIPSHVVSIGRSAFRLCENLFSLYIPSSVVSIVDNAFFDCSSLEDLTFLANVTSIGNYVFRGCEKLPSFVVPSSVTSIGDYAFYSCSSLASLTIPSSVTSIGDNAFSWSGSLTSVYVNWYTPLNIEGDIFQNVDMEKCTLYVPQGTLQAYSRADIWKDFGSIAEYDPTGIGNITTSSDAKEVSRYSVNGQRLSVPTKGLNLVKYSDGSVKKVAVQ